MIQDSSLYAWDPYDEGNCDTNAEFTIDHLNYGNPDWTVTLKIYNAAGGLIRTLVQEGGFQVGENAVEWDGSLEPPPYGPGGTAPKGLYTYTVEAVHTAGGPYWPNEMCKDRDKSSTPELRITAVRAVSFDPASLVLTLDVDYQVLQAGAVNSRIAVYASDLSQIESHSVGPDGDGQVPQGYSGTKRFVLQLTRHQMGTFTAVFSGEQTAQAGQANRDGQPKAARQGAVTSALWPPALNFGDFSYPTAESACLAACARQSSCVDGTRYDPVALDATTGQFLAVAREAALLMTVGHGAEGAVWVGGRGDESCVTVTDITGIGGLEDLRVLLSLHLNCYAHEFAQAMVEECGADCSVGWYGMVNYLGVQVYSDVFWRALCEYAATVDAAAEAAAVQAFTVVPHPDWFRYEIYGNLPDEGRICPARYGPAMSDW